MAGPIHELGGDEYELLLQIVQYGNRIGEGDSAIQAAVQRAIAESQLRPVGVSAPDYYSQAVRWKFTPAEYAGAAGLARTLIAELGANAHEQDPFEAPLEEQGPGRRGDRSGGIERERQLERRTLHLDLSGKPADHSLKVQAAGRQLGRHGSYMMRAARRMRALRRRHVHPHLR